MTDLLDEGSSPDLGELLCNSGTMDDSTSPEQFRISSLEQASWAARKVVSARRRIVDREALASRYIETIKAWLERANREDSESISFLTIHLKSFAEQEIATQRRSKTVFLPGARLSLRKKPDRIEIVDESRVITFCEERYPEAIVIKRSVPKAALKLIIARTGEIPPAVDYVPGSEELYIESDDAIPVNALPSGHAAA